MIIILPYLLRYWPLLSVCFHACAYVHRCNAIPLYVCAYAHVFAYIHKIECIMISYLIRFLLLIRPIQPARHASDVVRNATSY